MTLHRPAIVRRKVRIDFDQLADGHWAPGGYFEDLLNIMSYFFPIGEKYFIDSVQYYEDRITDPVLKGQAKDFIYQEAMHTKQHIRSNVVLDQTRPYGSKIEKISKLLLVKTKWFTPRATQLAITCALEHFTALLSHYLLSRLDSFIALSDPSFGSLWAWHAVEETEHKAVCFDVYQHIFGKGILSYLNRVFAMIVVTISFLVAIVIGIYFIKKSQSNRPQEHLATDDSTEDSEAAKKRKTPYRQLVRLMKRSVSPNLYFDYFRPSFHPWDHDNSHFIEEWKRAFPDFGSSPRNKPHSNQDLASVESG